MEPLDKNKLIKAAETVVKDFGTDDGSRPFEFIQREVQHFTNQNGEKYTMLVCIRKFDDRTREVS